ncbi:MAG: hypothetical protein ABIO85_06235 [Sphingomicrobium sp.]
MIVIGAAPPVSPPPISRQAFIATMDGEYARLDINNDGVVTQTELEQNQRGLVIQAATRRALQEFAALDADHNGQVSQAEWLKARVAANPAVNAATVMKRLDRNGDGKVSLVEYRALTLANFDRLDTDLDGFVSAAEQRAGAKPR